MTQTRARKNQVATPEAVAEACDALFRAGEKITEATVRAHIGGGGPQVILRHMRAWEVEHRRKFMELEEQVQAIEDGDIPPGVPVPLWEAIKPVWQQVLSEARDYAERRLEDDRDRLVADREALGAEAERVRGLDERWQQEKQDWSTRFDGLNAEVDRLKGRIAGLAEDLIQAGHEATAREAAIEGLQKQLERAEAAVKSAQADHQADLARWAQQIDQARQEAKSKESGAGARIRTLEEQLASAQASLADLRIEHERAKAETSAAKSADARSQTEIARLRTELSQVQQQAARDAAANPETIAALRADLASLKASTKTGRDVPVKKPRKGTKE